MVYQLLERQMYCKYVNNQQREGPALLNAINKIAVVQLSMNCTYHCVGRGRRRNVCPYCWQSMWCNKIITVNSRGLSVVRTTHVLNYVNNQQREGPPVFDVINRISVLWLSINCTKLCVRIWRRRNICPYCWRSMRCNQITTVNSRGLLVVRMENALLICKQWTTWGSSGTV